MRKTPNVVVILCATVMGLAVLTSFTILAFYGKDATEVRSLINTVMNFAGLLLGGGSFIYAGIAAKRSDEAATNTNGQLQSSVQKAVKTALEKHLNGEGVDNNG